MRLCNTLLPIIGMLCLLHTGAAAQDSSLYTKLQRLPDKLYQRINAKAASIETKLTQQTEKYLDRLAKQEKKLQRKLWKKDSVAARNLFGDVEQRYAQLKSGAANNNSSIYSGHLDSMRTVLRFVQSSGMATQKYGAVLTSYSALQDKLNQTDAIKKQLKERQAYLKQQLQQLGLTKEFKKFQKQVYYYRAQVDEYKSMWEDPSKLEAKLLQLAVKIPAFRDFFRQHSMLAGMFRLPGNASVAPAPIPGLQTRASVQQSIVQRFGTGADISRVMQQNIQSAQAQLNQLKQKVAQFNAGSSDADMPDFKPNKQKTRSFWRRMELGANMQSVKSNGFFPVTSDIALSAGYKLNNKSVIGIGASYKMGWGHSIRHIKITHEGIGLRSFLDIKLKGSFYASGGLEYNYQQPFNTVQQLRVADSWQKSGLLGISKVVSVRSKLFKKTKVQLLWDFLSYQQQPRRQPVLFRIGYGLN